jgi:5-methylcytosine-specific restriction protein A
MPAWRRVRLVVLERDGGLCQIRGPTCKVAADQADHIVRPEDGGAWFDEANLRAACAPCNLGRRPRGGLWGHIGTKRLRPSREW